MAKRKLEHFAEMKTFDHVLEVPFADIMGKSHPMKGKWREQFFKNNHPIILELGCGKGEYSVGLGKKYPNNNYIGVDIKGARMWRGAKTVQEEGIENVGFLRTRIDFIDSFFAPGEIDEIWITFPDPQPRKNRARKRLTGPMFIERYQKFLKPGGLVHLKTDSDFFFEYTLEQIEAHSYPLLEHTFDLYGEKINDLDADTREILNIKTHYETLFSAKGFKIKYLKFNIN